MGGDTWEDRRVLSVNGLYEARKMFFDPAKEAGIQLHAILGNHDVAFKNTNEINSMNILEAAYPNLNVIFDTQLFQFGSTSIDMVSWINNQNYKDKIEYIKNSKADILLAHLELQGFEMTPGHFCETGMSQSLFSHFEQVWSGHFHIRAKQGNIQYLGNPSQTNWGDCGFTKGFHIFDTETKELTFIENPYNVYERIFFNEETNIVNFEYHKYQDKIVMVYVKSLVETNTKKLNLFMEKLNQFTKEATVDQTESYSNTTDMVADQQYMTTTEIIDKYIVETLDDEDTQKIISNMMNDLYMEALTTSHNE